MLQQNENVDYYKKFLETLQNSFNERNLNFYLNHFANTKNDYAKNLYLDYTQNYLNINLVIHFVSIVEENDNSATLIIFQKYIFSLKDTDYSMVLGDFTKIKLGKNENQELKIIDIEEDYPVFDAINYNINVEFDPESRIMKGNAELKIAALEDAETICLVINRGLRITKVSLETNGITSELPFTQNFEIVKTDLKKLVKKNEVFKLEVNFTGGLYNPNKNYSQVNIGYEGIFASWVTHWYPKILNELFCPSPGATAEINITAPSEFKHFTNGLKIEEQIIGNNTLSKWKVSQPVDYSIALGNYKQIRNDNNGLPIEVYSLPRNVATAEKYCSEITKVVNIAKEIYGNFPYEKYAMVDLPSEVTINLGGSSEQGFIFIPDKMNTEFFNYHLFAHEVGHCWWHNFIKFKSDVSLFSEIFAQYTVVLVLEKLYSKEFVTNWMKNGVWYYTQSSRLYFTNFYKHNDHPYGKQTNNNVDFHLLSNVKGFWLLHGLRYLIGDDNFLTAIKKLSMGDYGKSIGLNEIKKAFKDTYNNDTTIDKYWEEWFDRDGVPEYKLNYQISKHDSVYHLSGVLEQLGNLYTTPIELGIKRNGKIELKQIFPNDLKTKFSFELKYNPENIILDPNNYILKVTDESKVYYDIGCIGRLMKEKKYNEAKKIIYKYASEPDPFSAITLNKIELLILEDSLQNAETEIHKLINIENQKNGNKDLRLIRRCNFYLGIIYDITNDRNRALKYYNEAIKTNYWDDWYLDKSKEGLQKQLLAKEIFVN